MKSHFKLIAWLYLATIPFTYILFMVALPHNEDEAFIVNIFIAFAIWIYLKKISPALDNPKGNVTNISLFIIVFVGLLLFTSGSSRIRDVEYDLDSKITEIESKADDIESDLTSKLTDIEYKIDDVEDNVKELDFKVSEIEFRISFNKIR